jgi:hypothetical protein
MTTKLDVEQILIHSFDEVNSQFNATQITGTPDGILTKRDVDQIWKEVYDEVNQSLRIIFV